MTETEIDPQKVARLAMHADCCEHTARRALRGYKIRGRVGARVRGAFDALGIEPPKLRSEAAKP